MVVSDGEKKEGKTTCTSTSEGANLNQVPMGLGPGEVLQQATAGGGQLVEKDDPGLEEDHTRAVLRVIMDTPPKVRRSDALRAGIKAQPRACGMPVAKRTLAELKADEKKTGLKVPLDLPADFPRGPWVVDLSKPPDHAPASGAHDGGKQATIILVL